MLEFAMFTYGLLASFVLSGASRNKRQRRPNPWMLEYVGWVLCGASSAGAVLLLIHAARAWSG